MISREWYHSFDWKEMFEIFFFFYIYMQQHIFIKSYQKKKRKEGNVLFNNAHFIYSYTVKDNLVR